MKVDFHCHSTASDGTLPPAGLARLAAEGSFAAFALTDHDNMGGVASAAAELPPGIRFFPGVELSVEPGDGFDKFHLLGLGVDPSSPRMADILARILEGRRERNRRIAANFAAIGIEIPPDEIAGYANGEILARPHFARWLVDRGFSKSVKDAFDKYLLPDSPAETRCHEERWHPSREDAFAAIHAAGGICVMAHPKYWRRAWRSAGVDFPAAERELAVLKEMGLDGLEAVYQANTGEENVGFSRIAAKLGLLKTAGSDFHGANKPGIAFGMEVSGDFIRPALDRLQDAFVLPREI